METSCGKDTVRDRSNDGSYLTPYEIVGLLNSLSEENEQLQKENNMLKITIDRNESYIRRLTHQSDWHC